MKILSAELYNLKGLQYCTKVVWHLSEGKQKYVFVDYRNCEGDRVDGWLHSPNVVRDKTLDKIYDITEDEDYTQHGDFQHKRYDKTSDIEDLEEEIPEDIQYEIENGHIAWYDA